MNITARTPLRTKIFRWVVARLLNWLFRIRILGSENIPAGGYIVYANHLSWVDTPLLLTTLPSEPRAYVIGEAKGLRALWKRAIVWLVGCVIAFERHSENKDVLTKPVEILRAGAVLAFFPEGVRRDEEGTLVPFRRGIGHFTRQADVPLLPVALSGAYDLYWQKEIAVKIGIDGILVSNHGGRQIEALPPPIDCVPAIVKAVGGRATVLFDSGVRSGTDVARALALGADAALAGKAFLWGLGALGSDGPGHVIDLLIDELQSALGQIGAHSPAEASNVKVRHPGALHF